MHPARRPAPSLDVLHSDDPQAFRALMEQYGAVVKSVAYPFAADPDDLKDLCQDIWLKVYQKRSSYTGTGPLVAWLATVARNTCISRQRRRSARVRAHAGLAREQAAEGTTLELAEPSELAEDDRYGRVMHALAGLGERQRMAVLLRLYHGYDSHYVSSVMDCAPATVRSLLRHGLASLRRALDVEP